MDETRSVDNPESIPSYSLAVINHQNQSIRLAYNNSLGSDPNNPFFSLASTKKIFGEDAPLIWSTKSDTIRYPHNGEIMELRGVYYSKVLEFCEQNTPKYDEIIKLIDEDRSRRFGVAVSPGPASSPARDGSNIVQGVYNDLERMIESHVKNALSGLPEYIDKKVSELMDSQLKTHLDPVMEMLETIDKKMVRYSVKNYYNNIYKMKLSDEELEQEGKTLSDICRKQGEETGLTREYVSKAREMKDVTTYSEFIIEPRRLAFMKAHPERYPACGG